MEALATIFRLGMGGLLLDPRAFQEQRAAPNGLGRGVLLVLLVGLLVGVATWIGNLGQFLTQPDAQALTDTLNRGIRELPLYREAVANTPELELQFQQSINQFVDGSLAPAPLTGLLTIVLSPLGFVLRWLLIGTVVHVAARAFGGTGTYGQTLACTALATGANLLALVQVIPYAEVAATFILGMLATYVAVREAHGLMPWRAFWAVLLGPLLLAIVLGSLFCCVFFLFASVLGGALQGAGI